jgi:tetratricopeptide (TPR) repeat protein
MKMKIRKKIIAVPLGWLVLILGMSLALAGYGSIKSTSVVAMDLIQEESGEEARNPFVTGLDSRQSCTIIYASDGKTALAGNNEDYSNPFPIIWFQPAEDGKFGYMCFGFQSGWPRMEGYQWEGAMNEKGLFYDFATTEEVKVPRDPNKPDSWGLSGKMIMECSTVDEAIKLFSEYNFKDGTWKGHYLIGDRFGNSAIIEPFAVIRRDHKYQIATNFLQSKTDPENPTDPRYRLASKLFEQSDTISVDLFRRILDDAHMEEYNGSFTATLYSYIHDLVKGDVYIYNFHNYDNVVKLNIHEELKKGEHTYLISSLFPYETYAAQHFKATQVTTMMVRKALQNGVVGEDGAVAFYKEVSSPENKLTQYRLGEEYLNAVGYALLQYNKVNEAIELFDFMVEEFPQSANAYDSRGEAYMKAGNNELAVENYKKSLELNPDNENAKKMLEQLQK